MKYEFTELNTLLFVSLHPNNIVNQKNKIVFLKRCEAAVVVEINRFKSAILSHIFQCDNTEKIKLYVEQLQRECAKICDAALEYFNGFKMTKSSPVFKGTCNRLLLQLEELQEYIFINFEKYLNRSIGISRYKQATYAPEINAVIQKASAILKTYDIDDKLAEILCEPLDHFLGPKFNPTYNDLRYLECFIDELNRYLDRDDISKEIVCDFLLLLNYNHPSFFYYYIENLQSQNDNVEVCKTTEYYYFNLKNINQTLKKTNLSYLVDHPVIHEQIGTWLAEEIYFLEKKQHLSYPLIIHTADAQVAQSKVQTSLTVGHLSLAVKLLLDTGVIKNKNATELMRIVAGSFRTDKSEQISEDSLRNKAYNVESGTIEGLKNIIMKLWDEVRKY